ncbi:MAG: UDP-glucose 4-epimerase GalE [Candidatus Omnitrophica bacterium]|nr:UDP-glucose 4-epimerase GalE [Candidatus Omnitrophota bacterium]
MSKKTKYILVTGGAGYIGGHMAGLLLENGYRVVVLDNLTTGVRAWVPKCAEFMQGDLCSLEDCRKVFKKFPISAVMNFAAKLVVPESVTMPHVYYANNVGGASNLLKAMVEHRVRQFVFSSTAAVYGNPKKVPVMETAPIAPLSPYGESKAMVEQILRDCAKAGLIDFIVLRYFNVAGWDTRRYWPIKGRPVPTHLISCAMRALHGQGKLIVCGNDYNTPDGTGIRDFIDVRDLVQAHLLALKALDKGIKNEVFNLGTSKGFSVMDVIKTAADVAGKPVPYQIGSRRPGDATTVIASSAKAKKVLGWKPQYDLEAILKSEWERKL